MHNLTMERILAVAVVVLTVYSIAVTHKLGFLEGKNTVWVSVSEQVERGTLDLKDH